MAGIRGGVEITTLADIPSAGIRPRLVVRGHRRAAAGALRLPGSSGHRRGAGRAGLRIEIDRCGKPIGKQDQYAAAFGGLQVLEFGPGDRVSRQPLVLTDGAVPRARAQPDDVPHRPRLDRRAAPAAERGRRDPGGGGEAGRLAQSARELYRELVGGAGVDVLGEALHESWLKKRELPGVTDPEIDGWYDAARGAGATGGKVLGSGGGGFLLLYVPAAAQSAVRAALSGLREFPFSLDREGSRIIYVGR